MAPLGLGDELYAKNKREQKRLLHLNDDIYDYDFKYIYFCKSLN